MIQIKVHYTLGLTPEQLWPKGNVPETVTEDAVWELVEASEELGNGLIEDLMFNHGGHYDLDVRVGSG